MVNAKNFYCLFFNSKNNTIVSYAQFSVSFQRTAKWFSKHLRFCSEFFLNGLLYAKFVGGGNISLTSLALPCYINARSHNGGELAMSGFVPSFIEKGKKVLYKGVPYEVKNYYFTSSDTPYVPNDDKLVLVLRVGQYNEKVVDFCRYTISPFPEKREKIKRRKKRKNHSSQK